MGPPLTLTTVTSLRGTLACFRAWMMPSVISWQPPTATLNLRPEVIRFVVILSEGSVAYWPSWGAVASFMPWRLAMVALKPSLPWTMGAVPAKPVTCRMLRSPLTSLRRPSATTL